MLIVYTISCQLWKSAKWVWSAVVVTIVVGVATSLFSGTSKAFVDSLAASVITWLRTPGFLRDLTLSIVGLYMLLTLASGLISVLFRKRYEDQPAYTPSPEIKAMLDFLENDIKLRAEKEAAQKNRDDKALTHYLRTTLEANQSISSQGFATQAQAVIYVDAPLEAVFVPLQALSDRPVFDAPYEQQRRLELVRQQSGPSDTTRDASMQRLRIVWHSQLGSKRNETPQSVPDTEILRRLTPRQPAAVILGAPGSGKSTLLRRIALYMAGAFLAQNVTPPVGLGRVQIPLLIHLRDYAASLEKEALSLKQFIAAQAGKIEPNAATKLLDELAHGHCLLLCDGLDEIADARVRGTVIDALSQCIAEYAGDGREIYNRFLVTSRIAGYEPGALARYAHYTLLDLTTEQMQQFLTNWYIAIERYLTMSARGMQELTESEKVSANQAGIEQRDRLLSLLKHTPDLRQLAVNPLMLTLIVLLHSSRRNFPYQRIELYRTAVHTLLTTWNQESGRPMLSAEELPLAELLLSTLAYHLQNGPPVLSARDLYLLTRETMVECDQRQASTIKEHTILQFSETLRSSSGLLVEIGEQLFCLASPAFQNYFVARYLLRKPQEERKQFVLDHCLLAPWREPLLLLIADMSTDDSAEGQQAVNELFQAILDTTRKKEAQSNLAFALTCLTESVPWWIDEKLHRQTANRLFIFCGDALEAESSIRLSQALKASIGTWMQSQAPGKDEQGIALPLWQTWRRAMCDETHPACQEGAVWLLAELAAELPALLPPVLDMLSAPLLQLAGASDFPYPLERQGDLPRPAARAALPEVAEYAQIALLKLGKRSLASQVYESWLVQKKEQARPAQPSKEVTLRQRPSVPPVPPARETETGTNA